MQNITNTIKYKSGVIFSTIILLSVIVIPGSVLAYSGYSDAGDYSYGGYSDFSPSYSGYSDYSPSYSGYSDYSSSYGGYSGYDSGYSTPSGYATGYNNSGYSNDYYDVVYEYAPSYGTYSGSGGGLSFGYLNNQNSSNVNNTYNTTSNTNINNSRTSTSNTCTGTNNCNTSGSQVAAVTQPLTGSCPTSGVYATGQSVNWSAIASGGNGTYTYLWSGDASGSGQTVNQSYNSIGIRNATVVITSGNESITRSCSVNINNNNNNNLDAVCVASPSNPNVGQTVTWTANAYGGNGSYSYSWSGDVYGNGSSVNTSYNTTGTRYATVRVQDSNGNSITRSCQVYVGGTNYNSGVTLLGGSNTNGVNNGVLSSGVFLSQIPYTGVSENIKMALFVLGMIIWSAFMAWIINKKITAKKAKGNSISQKEIIERFKQANLARKGVTA